MTALKKGFDRPLFEQTEMAPAVSAATTCSATAQNSLFHVLHGRYIYYLIGTGSFWKYDTWADSWVGLTPPPTAPLTYSTMRFLSSYGYEGRTLSATASTVTIPGYFGQTLKGFDISIVSGTGAGQRRVISSVGDAVVADSGVPTAVSNVNPVSMTDTTKAWSINQWAGYQVRIIYGTGISQVRKVLYNSATVLTLADTTKYAEDTFCNPAFPVALSAVAGSQSLYQIESSVVSVDQNWTTTPDTTSRFRIASGAIVLMSGAATAVTNQWYDVATDTWYTKSCPTLVLSVTGTDGALEVSGEAATWWSRGIATAGTTTTLSDLTQSWTVNQWVGYQVFIAYGTAAGQMRKITANTATQLTFATGTAVDTTSSYVIIGYDGGTATSGGASTLTDTTQAWAVNRWKNFGVRILAGAGAGQVLAILSNTATAITTVRPWATQPDATSVYAVVPNADQMQFMIAGSAAVHCYAIDDDMVYHGRWNDSGAARISAASFGSMKPHALASISKSGTTATATTVNSIGFPAGATVTITGATGADAATYNITATATITGPNTFTYTMGATPASNAVLGTLSTTTLVDSTKTWTVNQWAGYLCHMANTSGAAPVGQTMLVVSNTANTLTFSAAVTTPANGVTRYVMTPNTIPGAIAAGTATGAGQTTGALADTSQAWVVNQFAGRRVRYTGGAGESQEATISSNSTTVLTLSIAVTTASVAGSTTYAILGQPVRGVGIELRHMFGTSDVANRGKYLAVSRGGAAFGFDRLNLTTDLFEMLATSPQSETLTTGSMFAYDGGDRLYFTKDVTQRMYYLDIVTSQIHGAGIYPYIAGTAIIGNRFEIFTTQDGSKFLWLNRHSNLECFRGLLFW